MKPLSFLGAAVAVALLCFSSCKQCNQSAVVNDQGDSTTIPQIETINREIEKDSLNPQLYFRRAQIYEANNDLKSAATKQERS